jgi:hypothetical protein
MKLWEVSKNRNYGNKKFLKSNKKYSWGEEGEDGGGGHGGEMTQTMYAHVNK